MGKLIGTFLFATLLCPTVVILNHLPAHEKHDICKEDESNTTHFHAVDLDCIYNQIEFLAEFDFDANALNCYLVPIIEVQTLPKVEPLFQVLRTYYSLRAPPFI